MSNQFDKLKYEFILKVLSIFEKYGGLVLTGMKYPDQHPLETLPSKDKNDTSHIAQLADELGNTFNEFLAEVEQPLLKYFYLKKLKASGKYGKLQVPDCFGLEHSNDRKCQLCPFEFDCAHTVDN